MGRPIEVIEDGQIVVLCRLLTFSDKSLDERFNCFSLIASIAKNQFPTVVIYKPSQLLQPFLRLRGTLAQYSVQVRLRLVLFFRNFNQVGDAQVNERANPVLKGKLGALIE